MPITRTVVKTGQEPTLLQLNELEKASRLPVIADDDPPELTDEQYAQMAEIARNARNRTDNIYQDQP